MNQDKSNALKLQKLAKASEKKKETLTAIKAPAQGEKITEAARAAHAVTVEVLSASLRNTFLQHPTVPALINFDNVQAKVNYIVTSETAKLSITPDVQQLLQQEMAGFLTQDDVIKVLGAALEGRNFHFSYKYTVNGVVVYNIVPFSAKACEIYASSGDKSHKALCIRQYLHALLQLAADEEGVELREVYTGEWFRWNVDNTQDGWYICHGGEMLLWPDMKKALARATAVYLNLDEASRVLGEESTEVVGFLVPLGESTHEFAKVESIKLMEERYYSICRKHRDAIQAAMPPMLKQLVDEANTIALERVREELEKINAPQRLEAVDDRLDSILQKYKFQLDATPLDDQDS